MSLRLRLYLLLWLSRWLSVRRRLSAPACGLLFNKGIRASTKIYNRYVESKSLTINFIHTGAFTSDGLRDEATYFNRGAKFIIAIKRRY